MRKKSEFTIKFVQPILKSLIVILGGFLLGSGPINGIPLSFVF